MEKLNPIVRRSIEMKLAEIFEGTVQPDIKKIRNHPMGDYRLRVGDFRLLFFYDPTKKKYHFTACNNRKDLY